MVARAWRTPLGNTIADVMGRLLAGERAVAANPLANQYACTLAARIQGEPGRSRDARFLRRMGLYGVEVAREALAASGVKAGPRVGLFSGVGGLRAHWDDMLAALANQRDDGEAAWERGLRDVHPYWMLRHLSNNVHALAAAELRLRGEGATFGGGTGGAQAIGAAARALHDHAIDAALVVTYDSLLEPETLVELGARRSATQATLGELGAPYSASAAGYVPGEAAAAIVLVRNDDASTPIAFIEAVDAGDGAPAEPALGTLHRALAALVASAERRAYGEGPDADELPRARTDVESPERERARTDVEEVPAQLDPDELRERRARTEPDSPHSLGARVPTKDRVRRTFPLVVDGAARAWPDLDTAERMLIAATLSPNAALVAITAAMGQLGAATAVVQAIALAEALQRGALPPIAGLAQPADGACFPIVGSTSTTTTVGYGLSTSAPGLAAAIRVELPAEAAFGARIAEGA